MRVRAGTVLAWVVLALACAGTNPQAEQREDLPRAEPGVLYSMGESLGQLLDAYDLDDSEAHEVTRGFFDSATHRPYAGVRTEATAQLVARFHEQRLQELARREEIAGQPLLERAASEPGAVRSETGLVLRIVERGEGPSPTLFDWVTLNHRGTLRDGSVFHTNEGETTPYRVQLGTTTRCWQQALGAVAKGARLHAVCPPALTYGWGGWPSVVPGGAVVSYDLELLAVEPDAKK